MASEEYKEPVTSYRELAGDLRQWWRENIVFNWPIYLILTVVNICYIYLVYYDSFTLWHPVELHWMALSLTSYWFLEEWRNG